MEHAPRRRPAIAHHAPASRGVTDSANPRSSARPRLGRAAVRSRKPRSTPASVSARVRELPAPERRALIERTFGVSANWGSKARTAVRARHPGRCNQSTRSATSSPAERRRAASPPPPCRQTAWRRDARPAARPVWSRRTRAWPTARQRWPDCQPRPIPLRARVQVEWRLRISQPGRGRVEPLRAVGVTSTKRSDPRAHHCALPLSTLSDRPADRCAIAAELSKSKVR
jgi:hypothetical protein